MPVPRFQLPKIVENDHVFVSLPDLGAGTPSTFRAMAMARADKSLALGRHLAAVQKAA